MNAKELFRKIPSVDEVLKKEWIRPFLELSSRSYVSKLLSSFFDRLREKITKGEPISITEDTIKEGFTSFFKESTKPSLRKVINATGVIVHTNLGRAPLPQKAIERIVEVSKGYSNLEYDLEKGKRGIRYVHVVGILKELTGCEDALVVNNNAAAVLLTLSALCRGKEVVVSRGELVEIGGSFRIPEVMEQSGCILKEVGTTNRTHLKDYENAIGENTGALMKVHKSNYSIVGFTKEVSVEELVSLGRRFGLPVIVDLGSGAFIDVSRFGLKPPEPVVTDVIKKGVGVVTISGDKLLGGPQAGIIMGKKELLDRIKTHPLNRAVRIDKLTLAALEETLRLYLMGREEEIPVVEMMSRSYEELLKRAKRFVRRARRELEGKAEITISSGASKVGGGSLPLAELNSPQVRIKPKNTEAHRLEEKLRAWDPPIVSTVKEDSVVLDFRTITKGEEWAILNALKEVLP